MSMSYSERPFSGERLLRWAEVQSRSTLGESTIRRLMSKGEFPPAVKITSKTVGWNSLDFDAWLHGCRKFPLQPQDETEPQADKPLEAPTATVHQICHTKRRRGRPRKVQP